MDSPAHQTPPPPRELNWLIECLGLDDTVKVIELAGGLNLWIPSGVGASQDAKRDKFDAEFGKPLAQQLIRYYGGSTIKIPLAAKWMTKFYHHKGLTPAEIARTLRCSIETVYRRINGYNKLHSPFTATRGDISPKPVKRVYQSRKTT
jgi:hypothetical protein